MKTFEQFYDDSYFEEEEKIILELYHLDNIEVIFDFTKYKQHIFYLNPQNKDILFFYNKKDNVFRINVNMCKILQNKLVLNYDELSIILKILIEKYIKIYKQNVLEQSTDNIITRLKNHFNIENL
ncbi:hypothetical protein M0Q50_02265 [bacterium]|jgi:hypothetical protein|nr:hypothetical protein [bacterium]